MTRALRGIRTYAGVMGNRLADALSPYLRAHAGNPVDWFPWGEEAFAEARATRCAGPHLHRLRHLPLVPRDGPRELQRSGDRADPQRALRRDQGRPRGASRRRRQPTSPPPPRSRAHLGWPLTVFATPDGRRVLRRHVLPAAARSRRSVVRAGARRRRRGVARPARRSRRHGGGRRWRRSPRHPSHRPPASSLDARTSTGAVAIARRGRGSGCYGGFGAQPRSSRSRRCSTSSSHGGANGRRSVAERSLAAHGRARRCATPSRAASSATPPARDWSEPHYERMLTDNALLLDVAAALAGDDRRLRCGRSPTA